MKKLLLALLIALSVFAFVSCDHEISDSSANYVAIESATGVEFTVTASSYETGKLYYSTDKSSWTEAPADSDMTSKGGKLYLRGEGITNMNGQLDLNFTDQTGDIKVSGNIMALLDYKNPDSATMVCTEDGSGAKSGCFDSLFKEWFYLTDASELELPAMTLSDYCYKEMFSYCDVLIAAPALPATTLAESCYVSMFGNCTSLTTAPALPATTLVKDCYNGMFDSCSALVTLPVFGNGERITVNNGNYPCSYMFKNCSAITAAANSNWSLLIDDITPIALNNGGKMFCTTPISSTTVTLYQASTGVYKIQ